MAEIIHEEETLKTKKTDLLLIDPKNIIVEEGFNVREDYGDMEWLWKNIVEVGQLEPITVAKIRGTDQYLLTEGHRRLRGINMAIDKGYEIPYVKAMVSSGNMEDRLIAMVITGIGKKQLNNLEEGEVYKRLVTYGYEVKDIVRRVNKSNAHVYNMLKLADAPMLVKKRIINGDITGNTVVSLMKDYKTAEELLKVVEEAVASAENEVEVSQDTSKPKKKKKATARHTGVLSPMKKFEEALAIAQKGEYANVKLMHELLSKLNNKDIKPESIAKLFQ